MAFLIYGGGNEEAPRNERQTGDAAKRKDTQGKAPQQA
jgi:hypothetical protein